MTGSQGQRDVPKAGRASVALSRGGGKRTRKRTVMPIFAQKAEANETPLILDPETESKHQLQHGISADGIPIKIFTQQNFSYSTIL